MARTRFAVVQRLLQSARRNSRKSHERFRVFNGDIQAHGKARRREILCETAEPHKKEMEKHLKDLTATGHIGTFLGMLTDSRSFLSYPRHQYFRRILCNYLGELMENGEITKNEKLVGKVIQNICYYNVAAYFGIGNQ